LQATLVTGLTINFNSANFPNGRYSFKSNEVSYVTPTEFFQSVGTNCSIAISQSGSNLRGDLSCSNMRNDRNEMISVTALFECTQN
jgi:hypothetical protein